MQTTILVLEDELPLFGAIVAKLKSNGFDVHAYRTVNEGLDAVKKTSFNVIWLDHYLLGKEDGLFFVRKIKKDPATKNIPIFAVTNTAGPEKIEEYTKLGIVHYYTKSDHPLDEIIQDIKKYLLKKT